MNNSTESQFFFLCAAADILKNTNREYPTPTHDNTKYVTLGTKHLVEVASAMHLPSAKYLVPNTSSRCLSLVMSSWNPSKLDPETSDSEAQAPLDTPVTHLGEQAA